MSLGIFKKGKGVFGKNEDEQIKAEDIYLLKMPTSTADLINNGEDRQHPFITANDILGGNGTAIISGGLITWLYGYTYNVPAYTYMIRGITYETLAIQIPLDPANADPNLDRIDVIVATFDAEDKGVIGVIKGQESAFAVKPTINYDTQIELTFVPVDGGTTQPTSVTNLVVYDENVEFATSDNTTGRVDFEFTTSPFSSSLCLAVTDFATGDEIKFTSPAPFAPYNYEGLQFQIEPTSGVWNDYGNFKIGFFNGDTLNGTWVIIDSSLDNIAGNPYAFNSASATWQNITIAIGSFGLTINNADNIRFIKDDNASVESFKLDLIRLQTGVLQPRPFIKTKLSQFINDGNGDPKYPFITAQDVILPQHRVTDVSAEYTGTGLIFWVRANVFPVNGKYETATSNYVTLLDGDPDFDRFDLIVAIAPVYPATVGTVGKITGIASANPEQPLWDFGTMYPIKYVFVTQGATTPIGFIDETVWDENTGEPTEWTFSTNKPTNIYVVADNAMNGSSAINYTNLSAFNTISFQNDILVSTDQTKLLTFYLKLKAVHNPYLPMAIFFKQNSSDNVASVFFKHGQYGFDANKLTYQKITIDITLLGVHAPFDTLRFAYTDTGHAGLYMDWVRFQSSPTIDIPIVTDVPTRTSQLINDGENGVDPFITLADIPVVTGFVETVTGTAVDNTDPVNPIVNLPINNQSVAYKEIPIGAVDGVNNVFTIANDAVSEEWIWVFMDGVGRNEFTYNSLTKEITMDFAPATGTEIYVQYIVNLSEPISSSEAVLKSKTITLTPAQIHSSGTTPIELLPSAGINKSIIIVSVSFSIVFNSIAYTTAQDIYVYCSTKGYNPNYISKANILGKTESHAERTILNPSNITTQTAINSGISVITGSPTYNQGGDSDLKIHLVYQIITL